MASGAIAGSSLAAMSYGASEIAYRNNGATAVFFITLGPPLVILAGFLGELVYIGLTNYLPWSDSEQEWLARAAGYHARTALVWTVAFSVVLFASEFIAFLSVSVNNAISYISAIGLITGSFSVFISKHSTTAAAVTDTLDKSWTHSILRFILPITALIFICTVSLLLSYIIDGLLMTFDLSIGTSVVDQGNANSKADSQFLTAMIVLSTVVCLTFSLFININRFSLHGVYRNRLVRTFLGASNFQRKPNPFPRTLMCWTK